MQFIDFTHQPPSRQPDLREFGFDEIEAKLWGEVRSCCRCRDLDEIRDVTSSSYGYKDQIINGYMLNVENPLDQSSICKGKYIGLGKRGTIMFVGMNPGTSRTDGDKALDGDPRSAGGVLQRFLRDLLVAQESTFEHFYFTDIVKCSTPDNKLDYNRSVDKKIVKNCFLFLLREIDIVQPRTIVLLGRSVRQGFQDIINSSGKARNRITLAAHQAPGQPPVVLYLESVQHAIDVYAFHNTSRIVVARYMRGDKEKFKEFFRPILRSMM